MQAQLLPSRLEFLKYMREPGPKQLLQFVKNLAEKGRWAGWPCWPGFVSALNLFIINAFAWARTFMPVQFAVWHIAPHPTVSTLSTVHSVHNGNRWSMVECCRMPPWTTTVLYRFLWAVNMNVFSILGVYTSRRAHICAEILNYTWDNYYNKFLELKINNYHRWIGKLIRKPAFKIRIFY